MRYLLDTNVISELVARQPNGRVVTWVQSVDESLLHLSVITIGEIKKGIERLTNSPRRKRLATWLEQELLERFKDQLVPLDVNTMLTWGQLTARLESAGRSLSAIDSLIAASAIQGDFVLVTRNISDFLSTGVKTFNPWEVD